MKRYEKSYRFFVFKGFHLLRIWVRSIGKVSAGAFLGGDAFL